MSFFPPNLDSSSSHFSFDFAFLELLLHRVESLLSVVRLELPPCASDWFLLALPYHLGVSSGLALELVFDCFWLILNWKESSVSWCSVVKCTRPMHSCDLVRHTPIPQLRSSVCPDLGRSTLYLRQPHLFCAAQRGAWFFETASLDVPCPVLFGGFDCHPLCELFLFIGVLYFAYMCCANLNPNLD